MKQTLVSSSVAALVGSSLILGGCGSEEGKTGPIVSGATLSIVAGDGQAGTVGTALPEALEVQVTDAGGQPLSGVTVTWNVISGGGSLSVATATSGATGQSAVTYTLGPTAGPQSVQAAIGGSDSVTFDFSASAGPAAALVKLSGDDQAGPAGGPLPLPYRVQVTDQFGNVVGGATIDWSVSSGGGSVTTSSGVADAAGVAATSHALGPAAGGQFVQASLAGAAVSVSFHATATSSLTVLGGGNNVPERFTSDLWLHGAYGYTGAWGNRAAPGNALKIWQLGGSGAPILVDSLIIPGVSIIGDVEVSSNGQLLLLVTEGGPGNGVYVFDRQLPARPAFIDSALVSSGVHTATFGYIGGKVYAFAAKNASNPALLIYEVDPLAADPLALVSQTPIPPNYGIHDTFVRDGLAFVLAWNTGVIIYDVGNGIRSGSPANPVEVSRIATLNGRAHNAWWFHNPATGERRYLFVGEEGPGVIGGQASGDLHVVDVSNLTAPREVARYHLAGAGAHNFWMDEQAQVLYAAFYNGGVVALDVSGTLSGDLANREIARLQPGGSANTYTWGVQVHQGSLYAADMLSGFWQLSLP